MTKADIDYLEEAYLPHRIVGAIDRNPDDGTKSGDSQPGSEENEPIIITDEKEAPNDQKTSQEEETEETESKERKMHYMICFSLN